MDLLHYNDYKKFLNDTINDMPMKGRGIKGQMAQKLRCQTSYMSQVLNGSADFSIEQCFDVPSFFNLAGDEKDYFITLAQYNRAGTKELGDYFREKLESLKEKQLTLHNRLKTKKKLSDEDSAQYFTNWMNAAIHILLTIKDFRTIDSISNYLKLPSDVVAETLNFLEQKGLAKKENGKFVPGDTTLHLDANSPFIRQHHINWRNQAIQSMNRNLKQNLHYSSVISLSQKDAELIKDETIKFISHIKTLISESSDEEVAKGLCIDFFNLY